MKNYNDAMFSALRGLNYTGSNTDMLAAFEKANGLSGNDSWNAALASAGYTTGALQDKLYAFWVDGGNFALELQSDGGAFGATARIDIPIIYSQNTTFKISMDVYPLSDAGSYDIWGFGSDMFQRIRLAPQNDLLSGVWGATRIFTSSTLPINEWHSIGYSQPGTGSGQICTMYHDADPVFTGASGVVVGGIKPLEVFTRTGGLGLPCRIKNIRIWSDQTETTLIHYWPINDGGADQSTISDLGVGSIDGTLTLGNGQWLPPI